MPYAGLIYNILPDLTAFASYTKIFDPQTNRGANGAYLEPMVGTSSEVGIKSRNFNGALNTSLTFFNTRESNVAQAIPGQYLADGITQVYEPLNGTRSRGFELETSGSITDNWNATLGISHYNIKAPGYGNVHPSLPRATIRSFTTYTLPGAWSGLSVGGGAELAECDEHPDRGCRQPDPHDSSALGDAAQLDGPLCLQQSHVVADQWRQPAAQEIFHCR